jgi:hypothetical protein
MKSGQRFVGIVLLTFGLFFGVAIWGGVISGVRAPNFLEMMFPIAFSLFAGVFTLRAFSQLSSSLGNRDRVAQHFRPQGIAIRYLAPGDKTSPSVWHLVFESNDDRFVKLDIEELYRFDDFFCKWFDELPDLDELDKTQPKTSNFGLV